MDLLIKIKENTLDSDIKGLIVYLKSKSFIKKFQIKSNDKTELNKISDLETLAGIHKTSPKAIQEFLENENDSIF